MSLPDDIRGPNVCGSAKAIYYSLLVDGPAGTRTLEERLGMNEAQSTYGLMQLRERDRVEHERGAYRVRECE